MTTIVRPVNATESRLRELLTVERVAYAVIVAAGVFLRFHGLGAAPLMPGEAAQSWPVWQTAHGLTVPGGAASSSALLSSLQLLLFWLAPGGDAGARFISAAAGSALLLAPWLLREKLGQSWALALALLFALDPWLVTFSRVADGTMLAVTAALFCLAFLVRLTLPESATPVRKRALFGAAVAAGLLIISGPAAWSLLLVLLLFVLLCLRPAPAPTDQRLAVLALFGATALLGATAWLARPVYLAAVSHSLGVWLDQIKPGPYPLTWFVIRLLIDQHFNLIFGLTGLALLWRVGRTDDAGQNRDRFLWTRFLLVWLAGGIAVQLLPGRTPQMLLLVSLPLSFGAARWISRLLDGTPAHLDRRETVYLLSLLTVLLISARFALNVLVESQVFQVEVALVILVIAIGSMLTLLAFSLALSLRQALWIGGLFVTVWLLLTTVANTWQLTQATDGRHPNGFFAVTGHPDVRLLVEDLRTVSAQRSGDAEAKPVQIQTGVRPDPMLGWYLRNRSVVEWVPAPAPGDGLSRPMLILPDSGTELTPEQSGLPDGYIGSRYELRSYWLPSQLLEQPVASEALAEGVGFLTASRLRLESAWYTRWQPFWKWAVHHTVSETPAAEGVQLWLMAEE
ncbi:MAG: hypothetical protein KDD92_19295 [Caldilineaceae bacterium]|nr:hypothetical protein [Caldilineaceae bacterium]